MTVLLNLVLFSAPSAMAQDDEALAVLAERLIQMRGEVDQLQSELDILREENKNRMAFLTAQQSELEANRDREALRVRQLEEDLQELRDNASAAGADAETLLPVLLEHIASLKAQIQSGLPFKIQERISELDEIEVQLINGVIAPQRGVNRLWAFIEDELRLTRDNSIYSQTINLDGRNVLADVAKLGTSIIYFRTRDLEYGRAIAGSQGWRFEVFESASDQEKVARLFDSLRKQIRQGYFDLPYVQVPVEG